MKHEPFVLKSALPDIPLNDRIASAIRDMQLQVGITDPKNFQSQLDLEISREVGKAVFDQLSRNGVEVAGLRVLDDGAGLGAVSVEAASRGALITSIEPGAECLGLTRERLGSNGVAMVADGEHLPFEDASFDVVVSVQVLEHVQSPINYLREAHRVLKPGGILYLACQNYFCFREPHYDIGWLPLLPKWIGALWLKANGRPTNFLWRSITYTTRPTVALMMSKCGFVSLRELRLTERFKSRLAARAVIFIDGCRNLFTPDIYALMRKR